ncbi:MAG: type II toxin-antitoxin system PemK/MazF family toxin [Aminobacteriaceae bacterium]
MWWVEFDPSVGSEIRKTRPAVIVSNDAYEDVHAA